MTSKDVTLSKALSWLLRHGAAREGLTLSPEGYLPLSTVLNHKSFRNYTESDVRRVVANNEKQRFTLRTNPNSKALEIKANQGHSLDVSDSELVPILEPKYAHVIHGTFLRHWASIKTQGVSRMTRLHIHLAKGVTGVISGLRQSAEVHIYIDLEKALADGIKFYESANGVILTRGDEAGFLKPKYFLKAINVITGFPPYTQPQDLCHSFETIGSATVERLAPKSALLLFSTPAEAENAVKYSHKVIVYGHFLTIRPYTSRPEDTNNVKNKPAPQKREFVRSKEKEVIVPPDSLDLSGDFCAQLDNLLSAVRLTIGEAANVGRLYADVENALQPHMPGCIAMPFGSITTGLGIKTSDADCYMHTNGRMNPAVMVNRAKRILQNNPQTFAEILSIPRANTPIVKFFHVPTATNCDLSFKTPLGSQNSKLIGFLLQSDPRLIPMAVAIKYWAKVHQLSGTGKMTNYALTMMIIFYLQQINILPSVVSLQLDRKHDAIVDYWNTGFDNTPLPTSNNTATISELIGGFFEYYSKFNFDDLVVCPYIGTPLKKDVFKDLNTLPEEFDIYKTNVLEGSALPLRYTTSICVQDPFEQSHNVASSIGMRMAEDIKAFIKFAAEAYEKEKHNACKEFLKKILLDKPIIIKAKLHPEYSVRLFPKLIASIASPDWKSVVRNVITEIFEKLLKIKLTKITKEDKGEDKDKNNSPRRDREKYNGAVTRAIWKRKQFNKLYARMDLDFETQQERITEEVLNIEKNVINLPFSLTLSYTTNPKNVAVCIKLQDGDTEFFREFGKFFMVVMQQWFVRILTPFTKHPERTVPVKTSESRRTDVNNLPINIDIDLSKNIDSDDSPRLETAKPKQSNDSKVVTDVMTSQTNKDDSKVRENFKTVSSDDDSKVTDNVTTAKKNVDDSNVTDNVTTTKKNDDDSKIVIDSDLTVDDSDTKAVKDNVMSGESNKDDNKVVTDVLTENTKDDSCHDS